jgi:twitching motility protein PilT
LDVQQLMTATIERGASDLHLNPGRPPVLRVLGGLVALDAAVLDDAESEKLCRALCKEEQWAEVESRGTTDFGLAHPSGNRFRVSVLRQRGRHSAVLRLIPSNPVLRADRTARTKRDLWPARTRARHGPLVGKTTTPHDDRRSTRR